jgi:hypothetical protein
VQVELGAAQRDRLDLGLAEDVEQARRLHDRLS